VRPAVAARLFADGPQFTHIEEMAWMTENYLPGSTPPPRGEALAQEQGTTQVVKDQASDLGHSSVQAGKHVADVAREQASGVAVEAGRQGRDLLQQAQGQMEEQAARGQRRVAEQLLSLSGELRSMADNSGEGSVAADLVQQAAARVCAAGQWLDARKPAQVVREVQSFARRRPTAFLLLAAGAGLVAGRLTRGLKDAPADNSEAKAAPVPVPVRGLGQQWAQSPDVAGYPPATAPHGEETRVPAGASGLPPTGGTPGRRGGRGYGERSPLATGDQAGRKGTL
jgi:hypothetical protein